MTRGPCPEKSARPGTVCRRFTSRSGPCCAATWVGLVLCLVLALSLLPTGARAQTPTVVDPVAQAAREKSDALRVALDSLEAALQVEGLRASDLDELRVRLDVVRKDVNRRADDVSPRLQNMKGRLQELGPPPKDGAPPEDPAAAADRLQLQAQIAELDAALKQNRVLAARADQVSDTILSRRRILFTSQLFVQSASVLDPRLWTEAAAALKVEWRALTYLVTDWLGFALTRQNGWALSAIAGGAIGIFLIIYTLGRKLRARLRTPPPESGQTYSRFQSAREALKIVLFNGLTAPAAVFGAYAFLTGFELVPPRVADVLNGLVVAVSIQSVAMAVVHAVLAPDAPWRRLARFSDQVVRVTFRYFTWTVWALSIAAFLNALHRALLVPVVLTVATSAIMSLIIGSCIARALIALAREDKDDVKPNAGAADEGGGALKPSVRFLVWVALVVQLGALVSGYISFASFVSARMVLATAVLGILYLLFSIIDSFLENLQTETPHARVVSKTLGLSRARVELLAVLISALLKVTLLFTSLVFVAGSWGASSADIMDTVQRISVGVRIGSATITLWTVLNAVLLLLIGLVLARGLQRWVSGQLLPRTGMEPGLQSSISTVVGYVGTIIALAVAMSELGISLENIALLATALSVGIGLGLQSIVNNFVSGLILLAERPIRVGDTINVKGEEGYVRRISVRSTEIETFERSTVIVPNSDLITGMVKNFTHSNTTGRVVVAVNVTYDADVDEVLDILVGCACDHPQVMQSSPPRVFLSKLGETGLVFELRCVVANVDYASTVKSDLHLQVLNRFRKANIGIACQPWAATRKADDHAPAPAPKPNLALEPPTPPTPGRALGSA